MHKILGISGSPKGNGNTAYTLNYALDVLKNKGAETRYISLAGKEIKPCTGCFTCSGIGSCRHKDYMEEIIAAMLWCDGVIIASPVYFGMITGQLKTMMDRFVCTRAVYGPNFPMSGKIGAAIACANSRNGGQETALQNIQTFLMQLNLMVISDGPGYCHSGGTIAGEAAKDSWGLETVKNLADNLYNMLERINAPTKLKENN